jgi:hypothetical protein
MPALLQSNKGAQRSQSTFQRLLLLLAPFYDETIMFFRLDYISCALTVLSTILVGRKLWQGWVIAGANSVVICWIGLRTAQFGFVPANLFCIALYSYNLWTWRKR